MFLPSDPSLWPQGNHFCFARTKWFLFNCLTLSTSPLKEKSFLDYLIICVYVCVHKGKYPRKPEEGIGSLGSGVTDSCKPADMGAKLNSVKVLCKSSASSQLPSFNLLITEILCLCLPCLQLKLIHVPFLAKLNIFPFFFLSLSLLTWAGGVSSNHATGSVLCCSDISSAKHISSLLLNSALLKLSRHRQNTAIFFARM